MYNVLAMSEQVGTVSGLIREYGFEVVILAVFIILFMIYTTNNNRNLKKFQEQLMQSNNDYKNTLLNQNKQLMQQIVDDKDIINFHKQEEKSEKDLFNTFTRLSSAIKYDCNNTMHKVKADRLAIYLFHNGTHSTHGIQFFKTSCMCEAVKVGSGVMERAIEHGGIPINLFDNMVDSLINKGSYVIINNNDLITSSHRTFISSQKIKYAQSIAIFDLNNNILGFIIAESSHEYNRDTVMEERKDLEILAKQLIPVLAYSDYTKASASID